MPRFRPSSILGLIALFVGSTILRADLKFPQLTALTRETPAAVSPGDTITYRFIVQPGTFPAQNIRFVFATADFKGLQAINTTNTASGTLSIVLPATWYNGSYALRGISIDDGWTRSTYYASDGTVIGSHRNSAQGYAYAGPNTHSFDFTSLGLSVSGAYAQNPRSIITTVRPINSGPFSPGNTARFSFSGTPGAVPLVSAQFTFRNARLSSQDAISVTATQTAGEFSVPITAIMANGSYSLSRIITTDRDGRQLVYDPTGNTLSAIESFGGTSYAVALDEENFETYAATFTVANASASPPSPPQLGTWTREGSSSLAPGDTLKYHYTTTSDGFPARQVRLQLTGPYGAWREYTNDSASGTFTIPIAADWASGTYTLSSIITDTAQRTVTRVPTDNSFTVRGMDISPYFSTHPAAETPTRMGGSVTLSAVGIGMGPVTYQWYRGEPGDTSNPVPTEPSRNLGTAMSATITQPTTFWVRLTSAGQTADSRAARVVIVGPPIITRQPVSQAIPIGGTATFTVGAIGTGTLTYEWVGTNLPIDIPRDRATLTIKGERVDTSTVLYCNVKDVGGETTTEGVSLSILDTQTPLRFTREPADVVMVAGAFSASFIGEVTGSPPIRYRWQKDGVDIPNGSGYHPTSITYTLRHDRRAPTLSDVGMYRVIVSNGFETIYSREAQLRFTEAPVIITQPQASVETEGLLSLEILAIGAGSLNYQWRKNGLPIAGQTSNRLNQFAANDSLTDTYDVVISNAHGSVTSTPSQVVFRLRGPEPTITSAPGNRTGQNGETIVFEVTRSGGTRVEWRKGSVVLQDGPENTFTLANIGASDSGSYTVTVWDTMGRGGTSRTFMLAVPATRDSPAITRHPIDTTATRGSSVRLGVATNGRERLRYQWRHNGAVLSERVAGPSVTQADLVLRNFDSTWLGTYDVIVTNDFGSVISQSARLSLPTPGPEGRLMNLSVRANAGGNHGPLIVGFVLGGGVAEEVPLLVRAAGPALVGFGVTSTLGNPSATLYRGSAPRFANDDWSGYPFVSATAARVGAFPFPASDPRDAALAPSLAPGAYTVHITGSANTSGVALAEIYDATPAAEINSQRPRLLNLSVQTNVAPGAPVIAGFVLGGIQPRKVLVRAIGPSLAGFGVQGALADPQLALRSSDALVASNDDWAGDTGVRDAATASGAFALSSTTSKDAALVTTLAPGSYTAQVTGAASASGLVLVEVYEVP